MSQVNFRATWMETLGSMRPHMTIKDLIVPGIELRRPVSTQDLLRGLRAFRCHRFRDQSIKVIDGFLRKHRQEIVYVLAESQTIAMTFTSTLGESKSLDSHQRIIVMEDDDRMMITSFRPRTFKQTTRDVMGIYAKNLLSRKENGDYVILTMPMRTRFWVRRWEAVHNFISSYSEVLPALDCLCFKIDPQQSVIDAIISINYTNTKSMS